nr:hypothetical protein [Hyphomonas sp. Mor2]
MGAQKYEFAGPEWRAFMHGMVQERLNQLDPDESAKSWSFCEVFTDAPVHLQTDGTKAAWHFIVRDGEVAFGDTDLEDATMKVVADYQAILPLARYDTRGEPDRQAELGAMSQKLMAEGKMTVSGDPSALDPRLGSVHDPIAAVTA